MIDILKVLDYYKINYTHSGGGKYKAICPFHDDHNPSLIVYTNNPDRHSYACFVCNNYGSTDWFIKEMGDSVDKVLEDLGLEKTNPVVREYKITWEEVNAVLSPLYRELGKQDNSLFDWLDKQFQLLDSQSDEDPETVFEQHLEEIKSAKSR